MKKVIAYLRMEEWLSSKVTMMLGILMYFLYLSNSSTKKSLIDVLIYFLFLGMFLAISYVANDFSDLEIDKKVGKRKVIATMRKWQIWMLFIVMFLVGNVPIFFVREDKCLVTILIIVVYILGVSYSAPGIRFKERGLIGLVDAHSLRDVMASLYYMSVGGYEPKDVYVAGNMGNRFSFGWTSLYIDSSDYR